LEPPAIHGSTNGDDERVGSPTDADCDLVVRKLGKKGYSEI
jgi:hypothetical protein